MPSRRKSKVALGPKARCIFIVGGENLVVGGHRVSLLDLSGMSFVVDYHPGGGTKSFFP